MISSTPSRSSRLAGALTFLADALGSTVALADSVGAVQAEYIYDPFGMTTVTGPPSGNSFQYTGRENDGTGLYYYRARYYHPRLQRFVSEDPLRLASGDPNLYSYVANNPALATDPLGLMTAKQAYAGCLTVAALLVMNGTLLAEGGAHYLLIPGLRMGNPVVAGIGGATGLVGLAHFALALYIYRYIYRHRR